MVWLPNIEKIYVSTEYRRVTDRRTDGQTDGLVQYWSARWHVKNFALVRYAVRLLLLLFFFLYFLYFFIIIIIIIIIIIKKLGY